MEIYHRRFQLACLCAAALCFVAAGGAEAAEKPEGRWSSIPIASKGNLSAESRGGEGGQWCHALEVDRLCGEILFYGTNTGGVYRSVDAGKSWTQTNRGFSATGACAFAIDPVNYWNVLALGIGTRADESNGIYWSDDLGNSWEQVLSLPVCGNKYYMDGLEFDRSSYDQESRKCLRAYCSTPFEKDPKGKVKEGKEGLYRSEDGGKSWILVNREMTDAALHIDPNNSALYAVKDFAVFVSHDFGVTFQTLYEGENCGFDMDRKTGALYLADRTKLLVSRDGGMNFSSVSGSSYPQGERNTTAFAINPQNPDQMVVQSDREVFCSSDGGVSWKKWNYNKSRDFLPFNHRDKVFAWSCAPSNRVFSFGGDFVIASEDGGENWAAKSDGICGFLCGGKFQFNSYNPQLLFVASQDYNGALTADGGKTWSYVNFSGKSWGGFVYGGYAASANVIFAGVSKEWDSSKHLKITFDGGKTIEDTGSKFSDILHRDHLSSYQSPKKPEVFFAADLRSEDGGKTWKKMEGCLQVYTCNPGGKKELYGCELGSGYAVVSYNDGVSWKRVNQEKEIPVDDKTPYLTELAFDPAHKLLYAAATGKELYMIELESGKVTDLTGHLPVDQKGNRRVNGIAVELKNPNCIYVSGMDEGYNRTSAVLCSTDRGQNFSVISSEPEIPLTAGFGGYSPHCIRIHPLTGELWCAAGCYGLQKYVKELQK